MGWKTVAICDHCWQEEEGDRAPVRVLQGGGYLVDGCYKCHAPTRGIFTRALIEEAVTPDGAA